MLVLEHAVLGAPSSPVLALPLPLCTIAVYASGETVLLLDVATLRLIRALSLNDAFPSVESEMIVALDIETSPSCVQILGASQTRVAVWVPSSRDGSSWRVQSSFTNSKPITCVRIWRDHIVVGHSGGITLKRLATAHDTPVWTTLWTQSVPPPRHVSISPSLRFVASASEADRSVHILSIKSSHEVQSIKHPHSIVGLQWRKPRGRHSEENCLYTFASDIVLRVFAPVIDAPDRLQLQAAFDRWCFTGDDDSDGDDIENRDQQSDDFCNPGSPIFPLDRDVLRQALPSLGAEPGSAENENARVRKLKELAEDDLELFGFIGRNGAFTIKALINLDKRPPTLLRHFTILNLRSSALNPSRQLLLVPSLDILRPMLLSSFPLHSHELLPLPFIDGDERSIRPIARGAREAAGSTLPIIGFTRTPDGSAVASLRSKGGGEIYLRDRMGRVSSIGSWGGEGSIALFDGGASIAIYHNSVLTVNTFFKGSTAVHESLSIPHTPPSQPSLIILSSNSSITPILSITPTSIATFHLQRGATFGLTLHSIASLPLLSRPSFILPVDPMAWAHVVPEASSISPSSPSMSPIIPLAPPLTESQVERERDVLVSVLDGHLAFWMPDSDAPSGWKCTGSVNTKRKNIRMARCSSAKKTAIVSSHFDVETLTIWDSKESEFSSGLEFSYAFDEAVNDLDWTSTDSQDAHSILAVGFSHRVVLLGQQRMTYFDQEPAWGIITEIDSRQYTPYPIKDSIWFAGGSLLVGAGRQILQYGSRTFTLQGSTEQPAPRPLTLFERVARQNGPLPDYHPQNLLQCLLWDKLELVKQIIVKLALALEASYASNGEFIWSQFPVSEYTGVTTNRETTVRKESQYSFLLADLAEPDNSATTFGPVLVSKLIARLEGSPLPNLSLNEMAHLTVLVQTTLEVEQQRRSLDANGLRYLLSMRSFYIINSGQISTSTGQSVRFNLNTIGVRHRIRYRDIVWAFFSESQEILLSASTNACGNRMVWNDARGLGVFLWLHSTELVKSQAEVVARNQYMSGDDRDPTACCLFYFALGKVKLVHGLWKQAAWHPEQQVMLKFLSNDFDDSRWRTAALKNAFALMSKQRYEYAAAFFLLGRSLKDAVTICIKQLQDFQLAVALARIVEDGDDGPILKDILTNTVVPIALQDGNRWLACWAFWKLKRRDLSVRVLLTPLESIAATFDVTVAEIRNPHYDDPSLSLLFLQLKDKSLQTVKGLSEISGRTEFNFVLQMARVFCRMGCHALALDLVLHWSFTYIAPPRMHSTRALDGYTAKAAGENLNDPAPSSRRSLGGTLRARRSSLLIDIEIPSLPTTRPTSPSPVPLTTVPEQFTSPSVSGATDADIKAKRTGLGSLMKSAKKDVTVPEFDMNAFF